MSIPSFSSQRALGCEAQIARARSAPESIVNVQNRIDSAHHRFLIEGIRSYVDDCSCAICENGCIDVSLCSVSHNFATIPIMQRWCDATTSLIPGGGHLILWSGWARPSVLKLTDRYCIVRVVKRLIRQSHRSTLHTNFRFSVSPRYETIFNRTVVDIIPHFHNEK